MLYLASQSPSRYELLRLSGIPFTVVSHESDECVVYDHTTFQEYVQAISRDKMNHVHLPVEARELKFAFVLTADTLVRTRQTETILGKPENRADAERMLDLLLEQTAHVVTGVVIEKRKWIGSEWHVEDKRSFASEADVDFHVRRQDREYYFTHEPDALYAAGSGIIERYGSNFLKRIDGSFTGVLGLPLYEVCAVLRDMGC